MKSTAPTAESAEAAVKALLSVYDYGFSKPLQEKILAARKDALAQGAEAAAECEKAKAKTLELENALAPLKQYDDITKEMLSDLKTQQRMIAIDMVGVEARIKACETAVEGEIQKRLKAAEERLGPDHPTVRSLSAKRKSNAACTTRWRTRSRASR